MTRHKVELSAYLSAASLVLVIYATHAWWAVLGLLGLFLVMPADRPHEQGGR